MDDEKLNGLEELEVLIELDDELKR